MRNDDDIPTGHGLSRKQQRTLLWMPLIAVWLVLFMISEGPEGGRDWPSLIMMWVVAGAVYAGVWFALVQITRPQQVDTRSTEEKLADTGSRAALIYDKGKGDEDEEEKAGGPGGHRPPGGGAGAEPPRR